MVLRQEWGLQFMAIILHVLKEYRENSPDLALWLFEKDYKTDIVVAVLLVALLGIGRLPLAIYIYAVHPEVTKLDPQAKIALYALGFEVTAGSYVLLVGIFYELTGGRAHVEEERSPISPLILDATWIALPRLLLLLITRGNPIFAVKAFKTFSYIAVYYVIQLCLIRIFFRDDKVGLEGSDGLKDRSGEGQPATHSRTSVTDEKDSLMDFD